MSALDSDISAKLARIDAKTVNRRIRYTSEAYKTNVPASDGVLWVDESSNPIKYYNASAGGTEVTGISDAIRSPGTVASVLIDVTPSGTTAQRDAAFSADPDLVLWDNTENGYREFRDAAAGTWERTQRYSSGAAHVLVSNGVNKTTTLESFVIAGGATQTGTSISLASGLIAIDAVADAASGNFTATVNIMVSNDNTRFHRLSTFVLSGTGGTPDMEAEQFDLSWGYIRVDIENFTGASATCDVTMGHR